ncbi:SCP2 sterol-binding domain-containing protein [Chthonobacter albigriseus]|uniref:SCP2 sterol-binding domain-containing protein n=1 Tax=Chthonobacter albigriseus TaxID=1683161 RepID=UPI0015EEDB97|nr:SCP2 sterol-binding domain-containing protein [Chthonobacter albigriseus]
MTLSDVTETVRQKIGDNSGLAATLKFDLGSDGVILVDANSVPNRVTNEDQPAECTIALSLEDLASMLNGSLDPTSAFMMGKLQVEGDMSVAMRLSQVV